MKEILKTGSRGAFVNIDLNDFFKENGQIYHSVGFEDGIKYLIQEDHKGGKKIPDYSHTDNRIYVLIEKGEVKSIGIYENHIKVKSIDLKHTHTNKTTGEKLKRHYHTDLHHQGNAYPLGKDELELVNKILKGAKKYL